MDALVEVQETTRRFVLARLKAWQAIADAYSAGVDLESISLIACHSPEEVLQILRRCNVEVREP